MDQKEDCSKQARICLVSENVETVKDFQTWVKKMEKKATFNKVQAINRIIKEWKEDRNFNIEMVKK